jgi:hypothetical protein
MSNDHSDILVDRRTPGSRNRPVRSGSVRVWLPRCLLIFGILLGIGVLLIVIDRVREAADRIFATSNLQRIGLAMHYYSDTKGRLPPAEICDEQGNPLLSWRLSIIPFDESTDNYNRFKQDEPWDSPRNIELLPPMPKYFAVPGDDAANMQHKTHNQVFHGEAPHSRAPREFS